jgi:hypothetical protein
MVTYIFQITRLSTINTIFEFSRSSTTVATSASSATPYTPSLVAVISATIPVPVPTSTSISSLLVRGLVVSSTTRYVAVRLIEAICPRSTAIPAVILTGPIAPVTIAGVISLAWSTIVPLAGTTVVTLTLSISTVIDFSCFGGGRGCSYCCCCCCSFGSTSSRYVPVDAVWASGARTMTTTCGRRTFTSSTASAGP